jgi:hypothetical protein
MPSPWHRLVLREGPCGSCVPDQGPSTPRAGPRHALTGPRQPKQETSPGRQHDPRNADGYFRHSLGVVAGLVKRAIGGKIKTYQDPLTGLSETGLIRTGDRVNKAGISKVHLTFCHDLHYHNKSFGRPQRPRFKSFKFIQIHSNIGVSE